MLQQNRYGIVRYFFIACILLLLTIFTLLKYISVLSSSMRFHVDYKIHFTKPLKSIKRLQRILRFCAIIYSINYFLPV